MKNEIKIFKNTIHKDSRGFIWTSWNKKKIKLKFNHDKFALSKKNVLRGFHGDNKTWKLMSCAYGEILLITVNFNKNSKNYLKIKKIKLSHKSNKSVLIPPKFINASLCLSDECLLHYKLSYSGNYNEVNNQISVKWNDSRINCRWPKNKFILSARDK